MTEKKIVVRWAVAVALLLLLFSLPGGCTVRIKALFRDPLAPFQRAAVKTIRSLHEGFGAVRGFGGLVEKNSRLSEEVIYLQARLMELEKLEQENRRLHDLLGFHQRSGDTLIPCQVVARSINGWWQSVRLDKGRADGIESNRAVISPDGLVGRTDTVTERAADVLLLSDPACQVSARVSRTGSFGLVTGRGINVHGYPVARMRFIHKDAPVHPGDAVVSSGLGGVFPKNVLIGYIERVEMEETGLYLCADILPKAVTELMDAVFVTSGGGSGEEAE
jgi:rod shape-determining protein MreC